MNNKKMIKIIKTIAGGKYKVDQQDKFYNEVRRFLTDHLVQDMEVSFLKREGEEYPYNTIEITATVGEFLNIDAPRKYLEQAIRCYGLHGNKIYDVPINNIVWEKAILTIAEKHLSTEEIEGIMYPEKKLAKKYEGVELNSGYNFAYEVEGGFDESGFENDLREMGFIKCGDSSVTVNARYSHMEIKVDGYYEAQETLPPTYKLMSYLQEKDFKFDDSCGIHIHTSPCDGRDNRWSIGSLLKISRFYAKLEDYFYQFLPKKRNEPTRTDGTCYSGKLKDYNKEFFSGIIGLPPSMIDNADDMSRGALQDLLGNMWFCRSDYHENARRRYDNSRYIGFNIHAYFLRGTLEFRIFDGDYNNLPYFLEVVDRLLTVADENTTRELDKLAEEIESLEDMLIKLGVSGLTYKKLLEREKEFGHTVENLEDVDFSQTDWTRRFREQMERQIEQGASSRRIIESIRSGIISSDPFDLEEEDEMLGIWDEAI